MLEIFKQMIACGFSIYSDFVLFEGDEDNFFDCVILKEHKGKTIEIVITIDKPSSNFNLPKLTIDDLIDQVDEIDIMEIYYDKNDIDDINEIADISFLDAVKKWAELEE